MLKEIIQLSTPFIVIIGMIYFFFIERRIKKHIKLFKDIEKFIIEKINEDK